MLTPRIVFALLTEIRLDVHYQGILPRIAVLVNENSGALVKQHYILVLVENVELGCDSLKCARVLFGRVKEFFLDKELYLISLAKNILLLCALAVDLYLLGADELIHHRGRQALYRLG